MPIKEYLEKRSKDKFKGIYNNYNVNTCKNHKKEYRAYCSDCHKLLCIECLRGANHVYHHKAFNEEIEPIKEELIIMKEIINYYDNKIENLNRKNINLSKKIKIKSNANAMKLEISKTNKILKSLKEKEKQLKLCKENYLSDLEELKASYENNIKLRKYRYEADINKICNNFKLIEEKINTIYKKKNELFQKKIINFSKKNSVDKIIENNIIIINLLFSNIFKCYISFIY